MERCDLWVWRRTAPFPFIYLDCSLTMTLYMLISFTALTILHGMVVSLSNFRYGLDIYASAFCATCFLWPRQIHFFCWSASRDLSKQLSAHVYAAAVGNASVTSNLLMWLSDTGCDNPPSESSPLIGRWQNEISNRLSLVTLLSTAWHTRLE